MELAGTYKYSIEVKTDSTDDAGTDAPIYIVLIGD
jgi:hypothetical protein